MSKKLVGGFFIPIYEEEQRPAVLTTYTTTTYATTNTTYETTNTTTNTSNKNCKDGMCGIGFIFYIIVFIFAMLSCVNNVAFKFCDYRYDCGGECTINYILFPNGTKEYYDDLPKKNNLETVYSAVLALNIIGTCLLALALICIFLGIFSDYFQLAKRKVMWMVACLLLLFCLAIYTTSYFLLLSYKCIKYFDNYSSWSYGSLFNYTTTTFALLILPLFCCLCDYCIKCS